MPTASLLKKRKPRLRRHWSIRSKLVTFTGLCASSALRAAATSSCAYSWKKPLYGKKQTREEAKSGRRQGHV